MLLGLSAARRSGSFASSSPAASRVLRPSRVVASFEAGAGVAGPRSKGGLGVSVVLVAGSASDRAGIGP
jgi:hypothetical protein